MKNAMKKLMSLVLVAVLLVAAVPFQAVATGAVTVVIVDNANDGEAARFDKTPSNGAAKAIDLLNYWAKGNDAVESVEFLNAYAYYADGTKGAIEQEGTVAGGDSIRIRANITWKQVEEKPEPAPVAPIKLVVKLNSSDNVIFSGEKVPANGEYALAENLLSYCWNKSWDDTYVVDHAWSSAQQANVADDAKIYAGDTLSIMLKEKSTNSGSNNESNSGNNGGYNENLYKPVFLDVYMNGNAQTYVKRYDITKTIAADGIVSWKDIYDNVILKNFTAKTSAGISMDGPYLDTINGGNWESSWTYNGGVQQDIAGLNEMRAKNTVIIDVMIYNATANGSATADSSNPKTGDMIFAPIAVMAVSASALALFFFYNKKRAI